VCATDIVTKRVLTFYFIGVTTSRSSIMRVFPLWMEALGHPEVVIEGIDLVLHGWTQAISRVLHIEIAQATFDRLGEIAASVRRPE
jgi:shikimate dehydrogenase